MTPLSFDTWIELSLKGTIVLCAAVATCWARLLRRSGCWVVRAGDPLAWPDRQRG